jgi:hypothetical protein
MGRPTARWTRTLLVVGTFLWVLSGGLWVSNQRAFATGERGVASNEELFNQASAALSAGGYSEALAKLEQLSDRGVVRANSSLNRAIAYILRAESPKQRDGDLGQAVAALREAQSLQPGDAQVASVLAATRREISRRRAARGLDPVVVELPIGRAIVGLVPENVWAALTLLGALALSVGLVLRRGPVHSVRKLSGQISAACGLGAILVFGAPTAAARHYRIATAEAVVVVAEARLLDAAGKQLTTRALDVESSSIPEGASVFTTNQSGRLTQVNWGSFQAWVASDQLRVLSTH